MNLRLKVWRWLGLDSIENRVIERSMRLEGLINQYRVEIGTVLAANARVLAKIEPAFGMAEDDPRRKEIDEQLARDIIARLQAEYEVNTKYFYRPSL